MPTTTVNVSFQRELLAEIDAEAKREARSRSELLREAAGMYVQRQRRWESLFALGDEATRTLGTAEGDVSTKPHETPARSRNPGFRLPRRRPPPPGSPGGAMI